MTTGVWETVDEASAASGCDHPAQRMTWAGGATKRGKPPRRTPSRVWRRALGLMLGWALAGGAALRIAQLIGAL